MPEIVAECAMRSCSTRLAVLDPLFISRCLELFLHSLCISSSAHGRPCSFDMKHLDPDGKYEGSFVRTAWSSRVVILRVLYTITSTNQSILFHGVKAKTTDRKQEASAEDELLWVFKDCSGLRLWQECRQKPFIIDGEVDSDIEEIVGHHEDESGAIHYAVKWLDYECPTWESEADLYTCPLITDYCLNLPKMAGVDGLGLLQ